MTHHIIKSLLFSASLSKVFLTLLPFGRDVHRTFFTSSSTVILLSLFLSAGLSFHRITSSVLFSSRSAPEPLDGSVVTINECGEGGEVDCLCDKHNLFVITGLNHGTYIFVFKECGEERHRQEYTI